MNKINKGKKYLKIYTDGSFCDRLQGKKVEISGIGVHFEGFEKGNVSKRVVSKKQCSNGAELAAIHEAITKVKGHINIIIHTDSQYSINAISKKCKVVKYSELIRSIQHKINERSGDTVLKKVKGHSGQKDGNWIADRLATFKNFLK